MEMRDQALFVMLSEAKHLWTAEILRFAQDDTSRGIAQGSFRRMSMRIVLLWVLPLLLNSWFPVAASGAARQQEVEIIDLGPGLVSFHVSSTALVGDTHYVMSRRRDPALLSGYDLKRGELTVSVELPAEGSPAADGRLIAVGDELYLLAGMDGRTNAVYRYDPEAGILEQVATVPAATIWDVDVSAEGMLYIATSRQTQGRLFEFDPRTGALRDMGAMETQPRQDARSVAATSDTVYVGMGFHAVDLWAVDRQTAEKTSILPPELKDEDWVYTLDASEDWIAVGTSGRPSKFVMINRRDYSDYRIMVHGGGTIQSIELVGGIVYFGGGRRVWLYDIDADQLEFLVEMPASRGLFYRNGILHGGHGGGTIAEYDVATGQLTEVNLVEVGVDIAPEWPMSLAAGGGRVFVGGRALGMIDVNTREQEQIPAPGETKSMVVAGGYLYMGMYTSGSLVRLDLASRKLEKVGEAPRGQNRPRIVHHDSHNDLILMGTQADEQQGGSLNIYDPRTREMKAVVNPFGTQAVGTITSLDGTAYVAAQREDGPVAAWDPVANERLWEITPFPGDWAMGLAALDGRLYGFSSRGELVVVDLESRSIIDLERLFSEGGRLMAHDGRIYGVTSNVLFRLDPQTLAREILVNDLDSRWLGWPSLAVDEEGRLYVIRGESVLQVEER
jgi:hypothetical protein